MLVNRLRPAEPGESKSEDLASQRARTLERALLVVGVAGTTVFTPTCANRLYGWSECCPAQPTREPELGSR